MTQRKQTFIRFTLPLLLLSLTVMGAPLNNLKTIDASFDQATFILQDTALYPIPIPDSVLTILPEAPTIKLNAQATQYVSNYLTKNNYSLQKIKKRSAAYFKIIETIFKKHGLPLQLKYLAVVESELKKTSVSHRGAAGPWQLMPVTAREMGLKITAKTDERTHYYKSTHAAAQYLKSLYRLFDDWLLVLAAYNSGPGTVYKAIRQSGSRNFWQLQYHLPLETRLHVKRFIGVHYFFEPAGSETVLTKKEKLAFAQKLQQHQQALALSTKPHWTDSVSSLITEVAEIHFKENTVGEK